MINALATVAVGLLVAGGVVLTIGAVVYLVRRPDPWPEVFGYQEVFHRARPRAFFVANL